MRIHSQRSYKEFGDKEDSKNIPHGANLKSRIVHIVQVLQLVPCPLYRQLGYLASSFICSFDRSNLTAICLKYTIK